MKKIPPANPFTQRCKEAEATFHQLFWDRVECNIPEPYWSTVWFEVDFSSLAETAQRLSRMINAADREGKKLCKHFAATIRRRTAAAAAAAATIATTAPATATAAFPRFASLPAELRQMVWAAAAAPPPCLHIFYVLEAARKPSRDEPALGCAHMERSHDLDPAGLLLLGDPALWTACTESRRVVRRVHAQAHRRLLAHSISFMSITQDYDCNIVNYDAQDCDCELIDFNIIAGHGRRINRLNRAALEFLDLASRADYGARGSLCQAEHVLRKERVLLPAASETVAAAASTPPRQASQAVQDLLRSIFEVKGDFPQGADDGPIPQTALTRLRKDFRLRYLLGIGS